MSHRPTKLLFLIGLSFGAFIVADNEMEITSFPVSDDAEVTEIDSDKSAKVYGAFVQHLNDKFPGITAVETIREQWYNWAKGNVNENGRLIDHELKPDSYFIPQTHILAHDSWINLGVDKDRSNELWALVSGLIQDTPEEDRHTSAIISMATNSAKSHAELVVIGAIVESQMHKLKSAEREGEFTLTADDDAVDVNISWTGIGVPTERSEHFASRLNEIEATTAETYPVDSQLRTIHVLAEASKEARSIAEIAVIANMIGGRDVINEISDNSDIEDE